MSKYCIGCKHLRYDEPEPGQEGSTQTGTWGAEDAALACQLGHWRHEFDRCSTRETFASTMMKAQTCPDYEERDLEAEERARQAALQAQIDAKIAEQLAWEAAERATPLYCSFCGRDEQPLVAGPSVYICQDCLAKSLEIFALGKTVMVKGDIA